MFVIYCRIVFLQSGAMPIEKFIDQDIVKMVKIKINKMVKNKKILNIIF